MSNGITTKLLLMSCELIPEVLCGKEKKLVTRKEAKLSKKKKFFLMNSKNKI